MLGGTAYFAELAEAGVVADDDDEVSLSDFHETFARSAARLVAAYDAEIILQRLHTILPDSMRGPEGKAPFGPEVDVPSGRTP